MIKNKGLIFFNPISGKGRAREESGKFFRILNNHFLMQEISGSNYEEAENNLNLSVNDINFLIAVGGDGLMNLALQEAYRKDFTLYVHPSGTGNDFSRNHFHKLSDENSILDKFKRLDSKFIDVAEVVISGKKRVFGQILSAGFDSYVNKRANTLKLLGGTMRYVVALFLELRSFKPIDYEIDLDGKLIFRRAMMVVVANGATYGGGMKVVPHALANDGWLDVLVVNEISKFQFLLVFPKVYKGSHIGHPKIELFKCKSMRVKSIAPVYADGEFFGDGDFTVQLKPNAVKILETN